MRDSNGGITLKMPVLIALMSACLTVGYGSKWVINSATTDPQLTMVSTSVSTHHEWSAAKNAQQDTQIQALENQNVELKATLLRLEAKVDKLLEKR